MFLSVSVGRGFRNKKLLPLPDESALAEELQEARDRALLHLTAGGDAE